MKLAIFWGNIPFKKDNEKAKQVLQYYLIEKNLVQENFTSFFKNLNCEETIVNLVPEGIISTGDKILNPKFFSDLSVVFILAELNWHNHALSDFYGITVAQQLRLSDINLPIFICSFVSEEILITNHNYEILLSPGTYFLQLPVGLEIDYKIRCIDEMELMDIKFHCCALKGAIRSIFHEKPSDDNIDKHFKDSLKKVIVGYNKIKQLPGIDEKFINEVNHLINQVKYIELDANIEANDELKITEGKDRLKKHLEKDETGLISLVDDKEGKTVLSRKIGEWKILLLDDKPDEASNLIDLLEEAKIEVIQATTFKDAVSKIDKDPENKINVVISDYRLKDKRDCYKEKQGYSFIQWIAQQNRFNELFVLSGLSRNFLKKTFTEYGVRVQIESKNDIRGENSENLINLANKIIEKGNETCDIIQSLPEAKQWDELKRFYAYFRSLPNYEKIEYTISIESKTLIDELLNAIESLQDRYSNLDDDKKRIELRKDIERTLKTCQIFKFKNLTAKTYTIKDYKQGNEIPANGRIVYSINSATQKKETKLRIEKSPSETLDEFISKLIARRIAIFLHFRYGIKNYTIANFLKRGTAFEDEIETSEQKSKKIDRKITRIIKNSRSIHDIDLKTLKDLVEEKENFEKSNEQRKGDLKQIFFNLALQNTDYPGKLLVEERNWLMKFDLLQIRQAFDITNKMDSIIYDFLNSNLSKINIKSEQQYRNFRNQFQSVLKPSDKLTLGHKASCFYSIKKIKDAVETLLALIQSIGTRKELLLKLLNELNNIDCSKDFILNNFYLFCNQELRKINH